MDFQRYLLIAAIAVLSFMLMTEWVHFRQQPAHQGVAATQTQPAAAPGNADTSLPEAPAAGEIPTGAAPAENKPAANDNQRYVDVHTDLLDIRIDLQGGDIVFAALTQQSASLATPDKPFVLLSQGEPRTYIAQSGLTGIDTSAARARFHSDADSYRMGDKDTLSVVLTYQNEQRIEVTKTFTFQRGKYLIGVDYQVQNHGDQTWQGTLFGQLKRDSSPDPSVSSGGLGISSYLGAAVSKPDSLYHKLPFKDMGDKPFKEQVQGGWIAIVQHYFVSAWIPDAKEQNTFSTALSNGMHLIRFTAPVETVAPGGSAHFDARLYVGPKDQYRMREIAPGLDLTVDYGLLWWIAQPLFWLLTKIHGLLGNWGWSIMVLTLLVKAAFFWLNAKAYTSMANMRRVQPKLVEIRERYADDRQKQSQEMMNLYRTEKINPLGGCLPVVVQMPVFLALYWVLLESVELRHAPWILWIKDLSAMDPYLILPVLMGLTMFLQQRLNPPPPDPMQAKVMQWMPLIFTFFFLWFPAGLVLYYVVNNILSIAQQYIITKRIERKAA